MASSWCVPRASPVRCVSLRNIVKFLLVATSALAVAIFKDHSGILLGKWLKAIKPSLSLDALRLAKSVWQWLQPNVRGAGSVQPPPGLHIFVLIPLALFIGYQLGRARRRPQPSRQQSISQPAAPRSESLTPDSRLHAALELLRDLLPGHVVEELLEDAQQHSAVEQHLPPSEPAQQTHISRTEDAENAGRWLGPQPPYPPPAKVPSPLQRQLEGILEDDASLQRPLSYMFISAPASSPPSPSPSSPSNLALFHLQSSEGCTRDLKSNGNGGGGGRGSVGHDAGQHTPPARSDGECSDAAGPVLLPSPRAAFQCASFPYSQAANSLGATGTGPARNCSSGRIACHGMEASMTGPAAVRPILLPDYTRVLQQQPGVRRRLSLGRGPSYDSCSWPYKSYGNKATLKRCVSFSVSGAPYTSVPCPAASAPEPLGVARVGALPPYTPIAVPPSYTHSTSGGFIDGEVLDAWLHGASGGMGVMRGPDGGIGADATAGIHICGRLWDAADASAGGDAGYGDGSGCGGGWKGAGSGTATRVASNDGSGGICGGSAGSPCGRDSWPVALQPALTVASTADDEVWDCKQAAMAAAASAPRLELDRLDSCPSADSSAEGLARRAVSLERPASEDPAVPGALAAIPLPLLPAAAQVATSVPAAATASAAATALAAPASVVQLKAVPGAFASPSVWASAADGGAGGNGATWHHVGGQQRGCARRSTSSTGGACTAPQGSVVHDAAMEGDDVDGDGGGHGREARRGWRIAVEQGVRPMGFGASGDGAGRPCRRQSADTAQAMGALGRAYQRQLQEGLQDECLPAAAGWEGPQPLMPRGEEAAGSLAWGCDGGRGGGACRCGRGCGADGGDGDGSSVKSGSGGSVCGIGGSGGSAGKDSTAATSLLAAARLPPIPGAGAVTAVEVQSSEHCPLKLSDVDLLPLLPPSPPLASPSSPLLRNITAGVWVWDAWHANSGDLMAAAAGEDKHGRPAGTAAPGRSPTALSSSTSRSTSGAGSCDGVASGVHSAVHNTMLTFSSMLLLPRPPSTPATVASEAAAAVGGELRSDDVGSRSTVRSCYSCCSSNGERESAAGNVGAVGGEGVVGAGGAPAGSAASAVPQPSVVATAMSTCCRSGRGIPPRSFLNRRSDDDCDNGYGGGDDCDDDGDGMEQLLDIAFASTLTAALSGAPLPAAAPVVAETAAANAAVPCRRENRGFRSGLRRVKTCITEFFALGGGGGSNSFVGGAPGELSGLAVDSARGVILTKNSTRKPAVSGAASALLRTASSVAGSVVDSLLYGIGGAMYNAGGCGGCDAPTSFQQPPPPADCPPSSTLPYTDYRLSQPAILTHRMQQYSCPSQYPASCPLSCTPPPGDLHRYHCYHNNQHQQPQQQSQEQQQQNPSAAERGVLSRASAPASCSSPQTAPLPDCHSDARDVAGAGAGPSAPVGSGPAVPGIVQGATPRVSESSSSPFLSPFTTSNPAPSAPLTSRSSWPHIPYLPYLPHAEEAQPAGHGHMCSDTLSASSPPAAPGGDCLQAPCPVQDAITYPTSHQYPHQQGTPHPDRYPIEAQQHAAQHQQHLTHHQTRPQVQPQTHNKQQVMQQQPAPLMPLPLRPVARRSLSRLNCGHSITGPNANFSGTCLAPNCPDPNSNLASCSNMNLSMHLNTVDRVFESPDASMVLQARASALRLLISDASGARSPTSCSSLHGSGPVPLNYTTTAPMTSMVAAAAAVAAPSSGSGWKRVDVEQDAALEAVTAAATTTGAVRHRRLHRASTGLLGAGTCYGGSDTSSSRGSASSAFPPLGRTLGFSGSSGGGGGGGAAAAAGGFYSGCSLGRDLPYAEWHPCVSVLFADIVGFTHISNRVSAVAVMEMLNALYCRLDGLCATWQQQYQHPRSSPCGGSAIHGPSASLPAAAAATLPSPLRSRASSSSYGTSASASSAPPPVYKVQIIGDAYMVATGLLKDDPAHAATACIFALAALRETAQVVDPCDGRPLQLRVGIHSGPVVSGVVGRMRRQYSVFGDTVNVASRMESTGAPGAIHVSEETQRLAAPYMPCNVVWRRREGVEVKGKGVMNTYWLQEAPYHHHLQQHYQQQPLSSPPAPPAPAPPQQQTPQALQARPQPLTPLLVPQGSNADSAGVAAAAAPSPANAGSPPVAPAAATAASCAPASASAGPTLGSDDAQYRSSTPCSFSRQRCCC